MKEITSFVSYAHKDKPDVDKLLELLEPHFKTSQKFHYLQWTDAGLLPGEVWRAEIDAALDKAHFGLLLLTPWFWARDFIRTVELPKLLAKRMVVPVALHKITFDIDGRQVFRDSKGRAFEDCLELFQATTTLLEEHTEAAKQSHHQQNCYSHFLRVVSKKHLPVPPSYLGPETSYLDFCILWYSSAIN